MHPILRRASNFFCIYWLIILLMFSLVFLTPIMVAAILVAYFMFLALHEHYEEVEINRKI
jgi:hypothetical protein